MQYALLTRSRWQDSNMVTKGWSCYTWSLLISWLRSSNHPVLVCILMLYIQTRPLHSSEHKRCEDHAVMLSDRGFFGFETRLEWDDVLTRLTWWLSNLHLTFPIYLPTLSPLSLYLHDLQLYIPSGIIYAATHHIRSKQNYSPGHKKAGKEI